MITKLESTNLSLQEEIVEMIGEEFGFQSSDKRVFKLLGVLTEGSLQEMLTSINHKNIREIEGISNKI